MGVGDIGAMHDLVRRERKCKADVDGRGAGRINDAGMDGRPGSDFYGSWKQRRRDRISISDGAWIGAGAYNADDDGTSWADGMRGDGVGVGYVNEVQVGTPIERHWNSRTHIRGSKWKHHSGVRLLDG